MTFFGLRITGPDAGPYVLGQPLDVLDGDLHLGRLNSVSLSPGGELLLDDFRTTDLSRMGTWRTARLVVVEILSFFVYRFPSISTFGISLSADIDALQATAGAAARLAEARTQMLQSVGASEIRMTPRPHPRHAAHFVVSAAWHYNTDNAQLLAEVLAQERLAYAERRQAGAAQAAPVPAPPRSMIGRLLAKERHNNDNPAAT